MIQKNIEKNNENRKVYNLLEFTPATSESKSRSASEKGAISIIKSKVGTRIALSSELMNKIGNPESVQVSFMNGALAIAAVLPNNTIRHPLRKSGKKAIIYASDLVNEAIHKLNLDFSEKTSITFTRVEYQEYEDNTIAIIEAETNK